jgi:acyl-CoA thioesterase I
MSIAARRVLFPWMVLTGLILGCAPDDSKPAPPSGDEQTMRAAGRKQLVFLGTSLTAAYQLDQEQGFPALIQARIDSAGLPYEVVNAGLSGESAAGARSRVGWLLEQPVDVLVLETGANDMLRAADVDSLRANIQAVIDTVRQVHPGADIVLAGMLAAPNLGDAYAARFDAMYPELASRNRLTLIPFLLQGVAGVSALNLEDGIHPNREGHRVIAETVWRSLEPILRRRAGQTGA